MKSDDQLQRYLGSKMRFDILFGPAFLLLGVAWVVFPGLRADTWIFGLFSGLWLGLGFASLVRYIHSRKIVRLIDGKDTK
jgi:hypothetical protein